VRSARQSAKIRANHEKQTVKRHIAHGVALQPSAGRENINMRRRRQGRISAVTYRNKAHQAPASIWRSIGVVAALAVMAATSGEKWQENIKACDGVMAAKTQSKRK